MGCGPSRVPFKNGSIRLMATKLMFTKEQLHNLDEYFREIIQNARSSKNDSINISSSIEAIVERLVQRLIATVAELDSRFSSTFLISLNERRRIEQLRFEYLLRIDALSTPVLHPEAEAVANVEEDAAMPGFVRLRMPATTAESWAELLGAGGRLRRDLVKAKLTNLLATAIKQESADIKEHDGVCSPGQVVDAEVLDKILKQPEHCRIFYGPASSDGPLPEPKDHRIALVEDAGGILLKIGLEGFESRDVEVRLLIGVGISSWSSLADYPRRVPFHHCDALLHYTAAQTGMYAVAVGPYPGARCEDRATLWRIRVPAAETIMSQHYSDDSVVTLTDSVLMEILDQLRGRVPLKLPLKRKGNLRVVSRYILRTLHRWSLERTGPDPLRSWAPDTLSRHVLLILDELVTALRCQNLRCYYHPRCNVMLQCAKGGMLHHEDSYLSDSRLVESYLTTLHQRSSTMKPFDLSPMDSMELELISRWRRVVASLPRGTMTGDYGFSPRQLEYISLILKEVLRSKKMSLQDNYDDCPYLGISVSTDARSSEPIEDLVYLLKLVLKQARDQMYCVMNRRKRDEPRSSRKRTVNFEHFVNVIVHVVRRDRETSYMDLESYSIMARTLLKWLYFCMDHEKRILEPILRPYLGNLFNASHENAWHVESWRKRREVYSSEMRSLALFCKLVTTREVTAGNGLVESLSKGWRWAESVTRMIERSGDSLKLLFLTSHGVVRYNLTFANNKGLGAYSTWSKARNIGNAVRRNRTLSNSGTIVHAFTGFNGIVDETRKGIAGHVELRDISPLTYVVSMSRRRGRQRGPGGLIPALISLNKFRILQEVAAFLPQDERIAMLDMVQRVARESSRRFRRASCPDPSVKGSPWQTYRPRSESNLFEPPRSSSDTRCSDIVEERQEQLQREMREMHDTLTRGLRLRHRLPTWDSVSNTSWTSSIGSGRNRFRKYRAPVWDPLSGALPMWDGVSTDGSFTKSRSEEMISREESPKWNTSSNRRDFHATDEDRSPPWETLEETLNKKLSKYTDREPDSLEMDGDVGIDYLLTTNARKAFPDVPRERKF